MPGKRVGFQLWIPFREAHHYIKLWRNLFILYAKVEKERGASGALGRRGPLGASPNPAAELLLLAGSPSPWLRARKKEKKNNKVEKAMAPHSSTLAWKIPWMEEPGGLQSMGSHRVGHDWATSLSLFTFMHWRRKWQPTPVFLPGESQGQRSLVGCHLWGRTESDTTEATYQQQQQHAKVRNYLFLYFILLLVGIFSKKMLSFSMVHPLKMTALSSPF